MICIAALRGHDSCGGKNTMTIAAHAQLLKELKFDDNFMELFSINRFSTKQSTQEAGLDLQRTPVISKYSLYMHDIKHH